MNTARSRLALLPVLALSGLVVHAESTDFRVGSHQQTYGAPPVIHSGFYEVGSFGGSSLSEDARIYENRAQGIGTVYALVDRSSGEPELMVRADPRDTAPLVAYVDLWLSDDAADGLSVLAADEQGLIGELEKASADDVGLVADRMRGRWVHVIYGYTRAGEARAGWVRLVAGRIMYVSYDQQIRQKPVWFEHPAAVEFFDQPNGTRVRFLMPRDATVAERSYELEVLDIEPGWIKVRVTVPRVTTGDPDVQVDRSLTAWVRRLNARGRLQIAYAAAGC